VNTPVLKRNGLEIAYVDTGGIRPAVVFSHGFGMDHSMFEPQIDDLRDDYRLLAWDQRGWGQTRATGPFTLWDSAADLLALLESTGIERAVLCGMSQGGSVSLRAALLAPDRVLGLILIGTQAGPENRIGPDQLIAKWRSSGAGSIQHSLAANLLGPGDWPRWYAKWMEMDVEQLDWAYRSMIERDDLTGRLPDITCPALVVHGTDDTAVPIENADMLRSGLGGITTFAPIVGGPHASNITHPVEVNEAIRQFLAVNGLN
jgi:3-oxoadipate enol-lactonase